MTVAVRLRAQPIGWDAVGRRALDVVIAGLLLLFVCPVMLVLVAWVRLDSPGPALFRQERLGIGRRPFTLLKLRSMTDRCDDGDHRGLIAAELAGCTTSCGGSTKLGSDPRITRAGRFLRRTSLDELPQLFNVLRGDMSLVGPRPCLPWEAELFPADFAGRFTVLPGLTGYWQVNGRSTVGTLEMLQMDLTYVAERRLRGDLGILLRTVPALVRGDGAR